MADADADETVQLIRRTDNRDTRSLSDTSISLLRSQEYGDEANRDGNPIWLPFIANSIRNDALYHYRRLKDLESEAPVDIDLTQSSDRDIVRLENPSDGSAEAEAERLIGLKMVRGMLLKDLLQLHERIQVLQKKLADREGQYTTVKRMINLVGGFGLFGMGAFLLSITGLEPRVLSITGLEPRVLSITGLEPRVLGAMFIVASAWSARNLYSARRYDELVRCTSVVSVGIARFVNRVESDQRLVDQDAEDAECLKGEDWDGVPWSEVEG